MINYKTTTIIIQGAQCTGKSTLINSIKEQFPNISVLSEVARTIIKQQKITNQQLQKNINHCFQILQQKILIAQHLKQLEKIPQNNQSIHILDRCVISPLVYSLFYFKQNKQLHERIQNSEAFKNRINFYRNSAILFLLYPQKSILQADGVRKQSTFQQLKKMTELYKQILQKYKIKYIQIKQLKDRLQIVQSVLMQKLQLTDLQWQELKNQRPRVKIIPDQIYHRNSFVQIQKKNHENIPVLVRQQIDQKQYRQSDFTLQAVMTAFNREVRRNKDPNFVVIKCLHINDRQLILSYTKKPKNRLMAILPVKCLQNFLFVSINSFDIDRKYLKKCLYFPIIINNQQYNFFGFSKSNLRQFSCYFYKQKSQEITNLLNSFGDLEDVQCVSKKVSKLSLLYSSSNIVFSLQNDQIRRIPDVMKDDVCFSDGCGFVSLPLARRIKKAIGKLQYLPTVYQIRIKGIKGIVLINSEQKKQQLMVRQSMVKFNAKQDKLNELVLINYSKPALFAAINQQIIMLLSGLGIKEEYFLQLQQNYLQLLRQAFIDPVLAIQLLRFLGKEQIAQQIVESKQNMVFKVTSVISEQIYRNIRSRDLKNKLKIPLKNARLLYGAVYPEIAGQSKKIPLKQNQIFLRVTTRKGVVKTIVGTVIVTKNPCYYAGDIRVLQAVDISKQFPFANKLADVIIFSTEGKIPICTKISGSDYDGDQYFVCWDKNLIPQKTMKPYTYPKSKPVKQNSKVSQKNIIDYFVYFDRFVVGKINNKFLSFATISQKGVQCQQCIQLGTQLFSKAIDSVSTGQKVTIPDNLRFPNKQQEALSEHVWTKMTAAYVKFFEDEFNFDDKLISSWDVDYEMMLKIVQNYIFSKNYNDYQLFKIIKSWIIAKKSKRYDLFRYVNFQQLTKQQKKQIKQIPNFPEQYLGNPFKLSNIFTNEQLKKRGISFHTHQESPKKWRLYYRADENQINFQTIQYALTQFNNVLIGIKVNNKVDLVFSLTNMKKYPEIQNQIPRQTSKAFYVGKNDIRMINLGEFYKLFYTNQFLQIYQNKMQNSFLKFQNNKVSLDLLRFGRDMLDKNSKIKKQTIQYVEIYVGLSQYFKIPMVHKLIVGNPVKEIKEECPQIFKKKQEEKNKQEDKKNKPKYISKDQYEQNKRQNQHKKQKKWVQKR